MKVLFAKMASIHKRQLNEGFSFREFLRPEPLKEIMIASEQDFLKKLSYRKYILKRQINNQSDNEKPGIIMNSMPCFI